MTTSALVEAAWEEAIWSSQTVQGFTGVYFLFDASLADDAFNLAQLRHGDSGEEPVVNFFQCLISRRQDPNQVAGGGTGTRYQTEVRVEYYLQQTNQPEDTSRTHRDRLEAVDDLVRTALGPTWDGTVDYWQGGVPLRQSKVVIDGFACWKGGFTYQAVKQM